jgi:hypothetical protein
MLFMYINGKAPHSVTHPLFFFWLGGKGDFLQRVAPPYVKERSSCKKVLGRIPPSYASFKLGKAQCHCYKAYVFLGAIKKRSKVGFSLCI